MQISTLGFVPLRVFAGLGMAWHGAAKLGNLEGFAATVESLGFPLPWVFAVAALLAELAGGLLVAAGLFTRWAALPVMITMLVAAFVVHWDDPWSKKEFALLYFFVFSAYFLAGAGPWSLDALRGRGAPEPGGG